MILKLVGLPKISTNEMYAGVHWTIRNRHKNIYKLLIKSQFKHVFSKKNKYIVHYTFYFKRNPLDATNCSYMIKLIEDVIFESDKFDVIVEFSGKSRKADADYVEIDVLEN